MAKRIRNEAELRRAMEVIAATIIRNVSKRVLELLQDNIKEYVYNSHGPNSVYLNGSKKPSYEFLNAWKWDDIEKNIQGVTRRLFYNWQGMGVDEGGYKHSSVSEYWPIDTREYLADYLNVHGKDSSLWISVERQPFWNITIAELEAQFIYKWFDEEARKLGLIRK